MTNLIRIIMAGGEILLLGYLVCGSFPGKDNLLTRTQDTVAHLSTVVPSDSASLPLPVLSKPGIQTPYDSQPISGEIVSNAPGPSTAPLGTRNKRKPFFDLNELPFDRGEYEVAEGQPRPGSAAPASPACSSLHNAPLHKTAESERFRCTKRPTPGINIRPPVMHQVEEQWSQSSSHMVTPQPQHQLSVETMPPVRLMTNDIIYWVEHLRGVTQEPFFSFSVLLRKSTPLYKLIRDGVPGPVTESEKQELFEATCGNRRFWQDIYESNKELTEIVVKALRSKSINQRFVALKTWTSELLGLQGHKRVQGIDEFLETFLKMVALGTHARYDLSSLLDFNIRFRPSGGEGVSATTLQLFSYYIKGFRFNVLPRGSQGSERDRFGELMHELEVQQGLVRARMLSMDGPINSFFTKLCDLVKTHGKRGPNMRLRLALKAEEFSLALLSKIVLFYRLFTTFNTESISELKNTLQRCFDQLKPFWEYHVQWSENERPPPDSHNMFLRELPQHSKILQVWGCRARLKSTLTKSLFWVWLTHQNNGLFQAWDGDKVSEAKSGFHKFLEDCELVDFLESTDKAAPLAGLYTYTEQSDKLLTSHK